MLAEDTHWFDPSTLEVLHSLLGSDIGRRLVVMTSRELDSLPKSPASEVFELGPLTSDQTDQLVKALDPEMSDRERDEVLRRCDGVPLYIEEVVAKLKEKSIDAGDSGQVPDSLYEALFARLRSSGDSIAVVQAAAIIGSRFDRGLLGAVVRLSDTDYARVLGELRNARVLEPVDENAWRFRHELLREVAAELIPPSIRKLHRQVAEVLNRLRRKAIKLAIIAAHFERADRYEMRYRHTSGASHRPPRGALDEADVTCPSTGSIRRVPAGPNATGKR